MAAPYSCAFSGSGLTFFSSKNIASPELVTQVPVEEEIQSVFHSDEYAGVIVKNNAGEYVNRMEIYKKNGELVMKKNFTYDYTSVDIDGDLVILYNEDSCKIYNMSGVLKLYAPLILPCQRYAGAVSEYPGSHRTADHEGNKASLI